MAGESAQHEYERIRGSRVQQIRGKWPLVVGLVAFATIVGGSVFQLLLGAWWFGLLFGITAASSLLAPTQREVAWRKGAEGERAVGLALDRIGPSTRTLHDRLIPRSRANIDHILIAPAGVWTIDAKNYTGKIETRRRGEELWVRGRNRSKLLDQARRQASVVSDALAAAGLGQVPVSPALCFLGVEWPLLFPPKTAGGVRLTSPRGLAKLVAGDAVLSASQIQQVTAALEARLRPAAGPTPKATPSPPPSTAPQPRPPTAIPPPPPVGPGPSTPDLIVKPWNRYGKRRLYVNRADGTTLGYVDLDTNAVRATNESDKPLVLRAVADHLRAG